MICSIVGNVAENSGGVHCLKHGIIANYMMPGFDLTCILVRSKETLGIATEITLRILKISESACVLLADFTSIKSTGGAVSNIISTGIILSGREIIDNLSINAVQNVIS